MLSTRLALPLPLSAEERRLINQVEDTTMHDHEGIVIATAIEDQVGMSDPLVNVSNSRGNAEHYLFGMSA
jgi:hypothetical protein